MSSFDLEIRRNGFPDSRNRKRFVSGSGRVIWCRERLDQTCSGFNRRSGSTCSVAACPTSRKCELRNDDLLLAILLWCLLSNIAAKRGSYSPSSAHLTIKMNFLQIRPNPHGGSDVPVCPIMNGPALQLRASLPGAASHPICYFISHARHPHHRYRSRHQLLA